MSTYKEPTPEQIAIYRDLQMEYPPAGTYEKQKQWLKDIVRRKAEALGVPEHVIEAEHEAELRAYEEYRARKNREREADPSCRPEWFDAPRAYLRPIPTWDPEDDKKE